MKFAVQILNYINYKVTLEALKSINESGYKNLHIYVLDNGSSNHSYKAIEQYIHQEKLDSIITLLFSKNNLGFSGGHNYLYKFIKFESKNSYKFHLLLNSDAQISRNFFNSVVMHYRKEKKHFPLYGFAIHDPDDQSNSSVIQSWNQFFAIARKHSTPPLINCNFSWQYYPSGAALLIDPKYIDNYCLFDNKLFLYGEEIDLVKKLQHKGLDFKIYDDIKITHSFGQSTFNSKKKRNLLNDYYYQRSKLILMNKYHPHRVFLVRLTFLPIIFWRLMSGYQKHLKLLLRLFFSPLPKIVSQGYSDDGYYNLNDVFTLKRDKAKRKIKSSTKQKNKVRYDI